MPLYGILTMEKNNDFNRALFKGTTSETVSVLMRNGQRVRRQYIRANNVAAEMAEIVAANPGDDIFVGWAACGRAFIRPW